MVVRSKQAPTTTGPDQSIPSPYQEEEHWIGDIHWTFFRSRKPRALAQTLLFIHGAGHNGDCWSLGQHNWVNFFTERGHDIIVPSLPGHRPSRGQVRWQSLKEYLVALDAVIGDSGLSYNRIVVIGHSMGGILAQLLFARHPDLGGAVSVDSPAPHRTLAPYLAFFRRFARQHPLVALRASFNPGALFRSKTQVPQLLLGAEAAPELVDALHATLGGETLRATFEMRAMGKAPLALDGKRLLFLAAEHSAFFPADITQASADDFGAQFKLVPGAHNIMNTPEGALPAAQAIETFLASLDTQQAARPAGGSAW